jgi:metallo-beta-lactamase family protein
MQITFMGAVRQVTGSMHLLSTENDQILLDCGMFQGRRKESARKNKELTVDPAGLTNVVLSHAHIDHSGRLPLLTRNGYAGRIIATRATADACEYLLADSAHIQESDADYLNYKTLRSYLSRMEEKKLRKLGIKKDRGGIKKYIKKDGHRINSQRILELMAKFDLENVQPLYTAADAQQAIAAFDGRPYREPVTVGHNTTCTFYDAGHILGSAISILKISENGRRFTIGFTGDIGRFDKPIIRDPTLAFDAGDTDLDLLIMESTYGDRLHDPIVDLRPHLAEIVNETYDRGGTVLIPSFAFGRTQELLYILHELYNQRKVPRMPVYVDSPLATNITKVFGEHPEVYDRDTHRTFLEKGQNPFSFPQIHFTQSVDESIALTRDQTPHIVLSASGMCESGRILHHLRYKMHNEKNTILIVGYMAQHTLGRRILEEGEKYRKEGGKADAPLLRVLNKEYPLKAQVVRLGGFSAHGDKNEMMRFLTKSNLKIKKIAVVHGEEDQSLAFADHLRSNGFKAMVPEPGEAITLD